MQTITKIQVKNSNQVYSSDDTLTGSDSYSLDIIRGEKENYYYHKVEEYSGSQLIKDQNSQALIKKRVSDISYSSETSKYQVTIKNTYQNDEEHSSKTSYSETDFKDKIDNTIFYTSLVSNYHSGGFYYADFFIRNIAYFEYYSIVDNIFVYTIKDLEYEQNSEKAKVNEILKMNNLGMLISLEVNSINTTTNVKSEGETKILYNEDTNL